MATRYSGSLTIRLTVNDRNDGWRVTIAQSGRNVWRGTVGQAPADRTPIDAPDAFDDAARAALAFADNDGADVSDAYGDGSGYVVSRKPGNVEPAIKLPTIGDLARLIKAIKRDGIDDDFRADLEDDVPGVSLTIGWDVSGAWSYQTGDNSFTGGAYGYPHWAVVSVYRRSNAVDLAREIREQLIDASEFDRNNDQGE